MTADEPDPYALVTLFTEFAAGTHELKRDNPAYWLEQARIVAAEKGLAFPPPGWIVEADDNGRETVRRAEDAA